MHLTLISPYPDITAFGLRTIAAHLKRNGHRVRMVFLPDPCGDEFAPGRRRYAPEVLDALVPLCADSGLVGVTLMTNYFDAAREITARLRGAVPAPVIWGGVHPTIRPEECLALADLVCVGEGEDALLELVGRLEAGTSYRDVPNLWLRQDGALIRNPPRPLSRDLDVYPMPDYSGEDHHVLHAGRLQPLTDALLRTLLERGTVSAYLRKVGYQTMTGRGCPHQCTYCINDTIKGLYGAAGYLRWRSTAHVMAELEWVRAHMPYVGYIWISDDAFFARPLASLQDFCAAYRERIGLPFSCLASPLTLTREKMQLLVDAGLIYVQMGVQTGSPRIQELFNRKAMNNERMLEAMRVIHSFRDRLFPPSYDFILDVPYETDVDKVASLQLVARIPKPFRLQPFALVLYPGTRLHAMACADGLVRDEYGEVYSKSYTMREPSYLNLLFTLAKGGRMPAALLRLLVSRPTLALFNNRWMHRFFRGLYRSLRGVYRRLKAGRARP